MTVKTNNVQKGGGWFIDRKPLDDVRIKIKANNYEHLYNKLTGEKMRTRLPCFPNINEVTDMDGTEFVKKGQDLYDDIEVAIIYAQCKTYNCRDKKLCHILDATNGIDFFGDTDFYYTFNFTIFQLLWWFDKFAIRESSNYPYLDNPQYNEVQKRLIWKYNIPDFFDMNKNIPGQEEKYPMARDNIYWYKFCEILYYNNNKLQGIFKKDKNIRSYFNRNRYGGKKSRKSRNKKRKSNKKKRKTVKKRRLRKQK